MFYFVSSSSYQLLPLVLSFILHRERQGVVGNRLTWKNSSASDSTTAVRSVIIQFHLTLKTFSQIRSKTRICGGYQRDVALWQFLQTGVLVVSIILFVVVVVVVFVVVVVVAVVVAVVVVFTET